MTPMLPMISEARSADFEREQKQRRGMSLPLKVLVHGELAEQHGPAQDRGDCVAVGFGKEGAFDLRGAQGDIADDPAGCGVVMTLTRDAPLA